uniref:Uncharacterized protein n=1 Tax=Caldilinea aerophila TaxID=133453 RepID=A0A7C1FFT2_9CHLR
MSGAGEGFWIFVGLLVIVLVGVFAAYVLGFTFRLVKQEKRLVIYRLGVFYKLAGPGLVALNRHTDTVEREITVRSDQKEYVVGPYFMHGVPFSYVLLLWRRVDLVKAAGGDREKLAALAQYDEEQREMQIRNKLHEAFLKWVPQIEKAHKVKGDSFAEKLMPIFPGEPECERLFQCVLQELQKTLPTIGVFPDMQQTSVLSIKNIIVPPEVSAGFSDARSLALLREQFPGLSEDMLLHAHALNKGVHPRMTRLYMESEGGAVSSVRLDDEGEIKAARVMPAPLEDRPSAPSRNEREPVLSDDDLNEAEWKILKPIPRAKTGS